MEEDGHDDDKYNVDDDDVEEGKQMQKQKGPIL